MRQERDKKLRRAGQSVGPRPKCHRGGPCGRTGRQRAAKNTDTPRHGGRPSEPSTAHVRPPNLSSDGVTTRPSLSRGSPSSFRCFRHQRRHPASLPWGGWRSGPSGRLGVTLSSWGHPGPLPCGGITAVNYQQEAALPVDFQGGISCIFYKPRGSRQRLYLGP